MQTNWTRNIHHREYQPHRTSDNNYYIPRRWLFLIDDRL
ncbi:hypothetical protein T10_1681 [Trichinella papuae]|uniref:Uncharacterized protein n=1 Tax=Trichinella papuae TaxID=268474 RepID=A0A0V1LYB6_9BILA|nr:hypothetical protein T10_1681 [Trichinella papuae]